MKSLIFAMAILLLVNSCTKEPSEPAPVTQAEPAEPVAQAEQAELDKRANQIDSQTSRSEQKKAASAYQNAIRGKISKSSKDKDSNDDKDG
jgi:membrane-bound lytic murein transglycosylase